MARARAVAPLSGRRYPAGLPFKYGRRCSARPKSRIMAILAHLKLGQRDAATLLRLATPAVNPRPKVAKAVERSR
eukprot:scaffold44848_cov66-Phaeocystis_antarctica.AAC.1